MFILTGDCENIFVFEKPDKQILYRRNTTQLKSLNCFDASVNDALASGLSIRPIKEIKSHGRKLNVLYISSYIDFSLNIESNVLTKLMTPSINVVFRQNEVHSSVDIVLNVHSKHFDLQKKQHIPLKTIYMTETILVSNISQVVERMGSSEDNLLLLFSRRKQTHN